MLVLVVVAMLHRPRPILYIHPKTECVIRTAEGVRFGACPGKIIKKWGK